MQIGYLLKNLFKKAFPKLGQSIAAAIVFLYGWDFSDQQAFFYNQGQNVLLQKRWLHNLWKIRNNGSIKPIDITGVKEVRDSEGNVVRCPKNKNQIS